MVARGMSRRRWMARVELYGIAHDRHIVGDGVMVVDCVVYCVVYWVVYCVVVGSVWEVIVASWITAMRRGNRCGS